MSSNCTLVQPSAARSKVQGGHLRAVEGGPDPDWNLRADSLLERSCRDLNVIAEGPRRQHGTGAPALTGALSYLCTTVCLQSSSPIPQGRAEYRKSILLRAPI